MKALVGKWEVRLKTRGGDFLVVEATPSYPEAPWGIKPWGGDVYSTVRGPRDGVRYSLRFSPDQARLFAAALVDGADRAEMEGQYIDDDGKPYDLAQWVKDRDSADSKEGK